MKLLGPPARAAILVVLAPALAALSACKFDPPSGTPSDGAPGVDANPDAEPDAPPIDAQLCFGTGIGQVCLPSPPAAPLTLEGTVDTMACATGNVIPITGVDTCVIAGTTIDIGVGKTLQGVGARPLVLVASDVLTIAGTLSVSSKLGLVIGAGASTAAASTATCPAPAANDLAEDDEGGAGGGAGASFVGAGGDGGIGDNNNNGGKPGRGDGAKHVSNVSAPTVLRAGCRGTDGGKGEGGIGNGTGGMGGGSLYLIGGTRIVVSGVVAALGAGGGATGQQGGGGGGGSGGMIGLDAATVTVSGAVTANGGGGGEGGTNAANGDRGDDAAEDGTRAAGGSGLLDGGNGGLGSGGASRNGDIGSTDIGGGGGGGGGAGYIYVKGTLDRSGIISPAADDQ